MSDLSATHCGCNDACSKPSCNNGCSGIIWIIILLCICGNGNDGIMGGICGNGGNNNCCDKCCDDGCSGGCGSMIWIIILLCCCGNGF